MSLEKAIKYGKEKRKGYYGSKAIDVNCRNHGSCPWCQNGRKHKNRKRDLIAIKNEVDYEARRI